MKKKQLQKQGRCFVCLKGGHISKECTSAQLKACYYCKKVGHHHISIYPTKFQTSENSDVKRTSVNLSSNEITNTESQESEKKAPDSTTVVSNTVLAGGEKTWILLKETLMIIFLPMWSWLRMIAPV